MRAGLGLGFGVGTIARPALLADSYGASGFATIAGVMTVPLAVTKAVAPLAAAALHGVTGSYTAMAVTTGAACALAAALLLIDRPRDGSPSDDRVTPGVPRVSG